jgi:integrase
MMTRKKATRTPSGASSIYLGGDGYWHGRVTVGVRDDGRPDRRHVMSRKQVEVVRKVRHLEKLRDASRVPKPGQRWTVAGWLTHWIENIAIPPHVSENTHAGYRVDVEKHLIPRVGAHRLERLAPEHAERLYAKMQQSGLSAGTAHHAHRTLRNALNEAVRREHLARNPVLQAKAPKLAEEEVDPYGIDEIQRLLEVVSERRNGARWVVALALGLRQGEALGLKWSDVDLDQGTLRIRRGRLRPKYEHGCGGICGRKPGYCPDRKQIRPDTGDTKSRAGKRTMGLPDPVTALFRKHKSIQDAERVKARQLWHDEGWVFAKPDGRPLNPNTDYHEWKDLLTEAGLRDARLHDARHAAATVLLILGVPTPTAMALMGWSSAAMAKRYQHLIDTIRRDVAKQVGGLLWDADDALPEHAARANETKNETKPEFRPEC